MIGIDSGGVKYLILTFIAFFNILCHFLFRVCGHWAERVNLAPPYSSTHDGFQVHLNVPFTNEFVTVLVKVYIHTLSG